MDVASEKKRIFFLGRWSHNTLIKDIEKIRKENKGRIEFVKSVYVLRFDISTRT